MRALSIGRVTSCSTCSATIPGASVSIEASAGDALGNSSTVSFEATAAP